MSLGLNTVNSQRRHRYSCVYMRARTHTLSYLTQQLCPPQGIYTSIHPSVSRRDALSCGCKMTVFHKQIRDRKLSSFLTKHGKKKQKNRFAYPEGNITACKAAKQHVCCKIIQKKKRKAREDKRQERKWMFICWQLNFKCQIGLQLIIYLIIY